MPQAYVAQLAKEKGIETSEAEKKWEAAKDAAKKYKGQDNYYAVVTSIFKKMMGVKEEELEPSDKIYIKEFEESEIYHKNIVARVLCKV